MKTETMINLNPVQENELKELMNQTKETLASDISKEIINTREKQFSAADMWNLHKKQRFAADMRRRMN